MTQGEKVRAVRKKLKLSQEQFALNLGVGRTAVSKIEKGEVNLTEQMTKLICREYNVKYQYLTGEDAEMFESLPKEVFDKICAERGLDERDREMLETYMELSKSERDVIKNYIEKMVEKRLKKLRNQQ